MLKTSDIRIRDPFILPYEGKYYMFGTNGTFAWEGAGGFPCYISEDLENWSDGIEAFKAPEGFWATTNFWAPEVHYYKGKFYMFASFFSPEKTRASQILVSDKPEGPYAVHSEPITPPDWLSLDGTFFVDDDKKPWMVFCHEWVQIGTGTICAIPLTDDLKAAAGEPVTLFAADEAPWVSPNDDKIIAGKQCMVTDGPFIVKDDGGLTMFWSSFSDGYYAEGVAVSESGKLGGPWKQLEKPLFDKDGGHGMLFRKFNGELCFTMHKPNVNPNERAAFFEVVRENGEYRIK